MTCIICLPYATILDYGLCIMFRERLCVCNN